MKVAIIGLVILVIILIVVILILYAKRVLWFIRRYNMLRLNLKDNDDTVLFVNPVNGIEIHKITDRLSFRIGEQEKPGLRLSFTTCGSCELMHTVVWYSDFESRDRAYGYVLTKIDEYLFPPQVELGAICQNDFAMPEEEQ